jgi:HpiC1 cyclase/Immunoglobulin domain
VNSNKNRQYLLAGLTAVLASGAILSTTAAPVNIPDFSFENTSVADGATTGAPNVGTNWTAAGNGGVFLRNPQDDRFAGSSETTVPPGNLPAPGNGTNCVIVNINGNTGYVWQNIGGLQANTIYTLTVAAGLDLIDSGGGGVIALVNGVNPFGTILASAPVDTTTNTPGTFSDVTLTFTTGQIVSGPLTILLRGDSGTQIIFDNVRLDATPAPNSPAALAITATPTNFVYVGTVVTLKEDPAGASPFSYQWQTDSGSGGVTFTAIPGATTSSYAVNTSGFSPGSPKEYRVVVTNTFGVSTSAPVAVTAITGAPVVKSDVLPVTGSDIVGSSVTFTASFEGSLPIHYQWQHDGVDILGANSATLTLNNLQFSDTGSYQLVATNSIGTTVSSARSFTVNPAPDPVDGVVISVATQTGNGGSTSFTPTWTVSTNSLVAGVAPSSVGTGNFSADSSGVVAVLTDGKYGQLNPAGNGSTDFVTCGVNNQGGGFVTYTLPVSATGYDITNIVVYGGWSDGGRDQQKYIVYYSTVASPTTFNPIADVDFNPTLPGTVQSSTRITLTDTNGALAKNVAAIKFDFNILAPPTVENGYAGYSEIGIAGFPSAPAPVIATNTTPTSAIDVEGSSVTFLAAFNSASPVTYQWRKDTGGGPVPIPGANGQTLTLMNLQLSDTASYSLLASNASGVTVSTPSALTVTSAPGPDGNGVIASPATQTGIAPFRTTWNVVPGSLIAGALPSSIGSGNFNNEGGGGVPRLTDGSFGSTGNGQPNVSLATGGPGAGNSVTYNLLGSASGYDVTNITTFSGWSDKGRDGQSYNVFYSTAADPNNFIQLTSIYYNPSGANIPTADRVTLTPSSGVLAANVVKVRIDFLNAENGWSGYAEIGLYGSPSAAVNAAPFLAEDIIPATGSDVVGSSVTFKATINGSSPISYQWRKDTGSGPIDIPGATGATLTLNNLQLSDSATPGYSLQASNQFGLVTSSAASFTVNPVPAPVNGVIAAPANQTGAGGTVFKPTWTVPSGSLIAGAMPSTLGSGNFAQEGALGVSALTDGVVGASGGGALSFATCGTGAGTAVNYALAGAASGSSLTKIVTYAGWGDSGRDGQGYTIYYSTVANPTTYIQLATTSYNPSIAGGVPSADRITLVSASGGALAQNVANVRFEFLNVENGWSGYSEIELFGTPAPPAIGSTTFSGGKLILTGSGGTPGGSYSWLTSTDITAPLANWTTNSTGLFNGSGAFSNAIPVNTTEAVRFFRLKTP